MPGGDKNINGTDGVETRFSTTYQPFKNGRKPVLFSEITKEWKAAGIEQATPSRVQEVYEYLLSLPISEIRAIAGEIGKNAESDDPTQPNDIPIVMRIAAKDLTGPHGSLIVETMLSRAQGKPKQQTDVNHSGSITTGPDFSKLTDDELDAYLKLCEKLKSD